MFPIRDENPHFLRPYVTGTLIAINVAVWLLVQRVGLDPAMSAAVCKFGLIPGEVTRAANPGTLVPLSAQINCVLSGTAALHTFFTSMFMHGGWLHLLANVWFLWIFGNNVEDSMGHLRFLVFYLLCGCAAALLHVWSSPASVAPMLGASGAIGGVMGAYVVLYPRVKVHLLIFLVVFITTISIPAVWVGAYWLAIQLIGGFGTLGRTGGGIAFWAHIGGFLAGMALVFLFRDADMVARHPYAGWRRKVAVRPGGADDH